jgi:hypothetical protein
LTGFSFEWGSGLARILSRPLDGINLRWMSRDTLELWEGACQRVVSGLIARGIGIWPANIRNDKMNQSQNPHSNVAKCATLEWATAFIFLLLDSSSYCEQVGLK